MTSQPSRVSMGEPQLPIFTNSHGCRGVSQEPRVVPEMDVVRKHQVEALVILARDHREAAVDAAREERHAFVLHGVAIQRHHAEVLKIRRLDQLRQDGASIVGRVGGVIGDSPVLLTEAHETRIFDAVALIRRGGKDDALRETDGGREMHFIVGHREPLHDLHGAFDLAAPPAGKRRLHGFFQILVGKVLAQRGHDLARPIVLKSHLLQLVRKMAFRYVGFSTMARSDDQAGDLVDLDSGAAPQDSGAKFNRRDMALARRPQAQHETERARPALPSGRGAERWRD